MKIAQILSNPDSTMFSIEVFPPRTRHVEGRDLRQHLGEIFDTVEKLKKFKPAFVSVTYNSANLTKVTSIPVAAIIKDRYAIETIAHLTCINSPPNEIRRIIDVLRYFNIENILALRGDIPKECVPDPTCPKYASDLLREVRSIAPDFSIGVAAYPEGHPECIDRKGEKDVEKSWNHLAIKVSEGADFAISQLFLDNSYLFKLQRGMEKRGLDIPLIPGIMPLTTSRNLKVIGELTGATIPDDLRNMVEKNRDDPSEVFEIGVEHAVRQCKGLMDRVPCIHFYTMDRWEATDRIITELQ